MWKNYFFVNLKSFISLNNKIPCERTHKGFLFLEWCLQESNQGHMDFQSIALPTELRHPTSC